MFDKRNTRIPKVKGSFCRGVPIFTRAVSRTSRVYNFSLARYFKDSRVLGRAGCIRPTLYTFSCNIFGTLGGTTPSLGIINKVKLSLNRCPTLVTSSVLSFRANVGLISGETRFVRRSYSHRRDSVTTVLGPSIRLIRGVYTRVSASRGPISVTGCGSPGRIIVKNSSRTMEGTSRGLSRRNGVHMIRLGIGNTFRAPLFEASSRELNRILGSISFGSPRFIVRDGASEVPFAGRGTTRVLRQRIVSPARFTTYIRGVVGSYRVRAFIRVKPNRALSGFIERVSQGIKHTSVRALRGVRGFSLWQKKGE